MIHISDHKFIFKDNIKALHNAFVSIMRYKFINCDGEGSRRSKCCEAILYLQMYIFYGDQCLQCLTQPVMIFSFSLRKATAGYFISR